MKPARLPCCKFLLALGPDFAQRSKHSYHFEVTDKQKHRIDLFSHNLLTKNKGQDCARSGS